MNGSATAITSCWKQRWSIASYLRSASSLFACLSHGAGVLPGRGFFSQRRCRADASARSRPRRTACGRDSSSLREVENYLRQQIPKENWSPSWTILGCRTQASIFRTVTPAWSAPAMRKFWWALNQEHHHPTADYVRKLREGLPPFPGVEFFFTCRYRHSRS